MLLAHSKKIALSAAFLMALAIGSTLSAQTPRLAQHPGIDQAITDQTQPVVQLKSVVGNCGCNTGNASAHSGLTLCDIMHGCAFKRETAQLWDGYCEEIKTHCDSGCSPLFKGRMHGGMHSGMLGGCKTCGLAGGTHGCHGCNAGFGKHVHGNRGLLGSAHCSDCAGACQGKTTTTTLPVISAKSGCAAGCAAGCADAQPNQLKTPPAETAPKTEAAYQQLEAKPVSTRTRFLNMFPEKD